MSNHTMRGRIVRRFPKRILSDADQAFEVRRKAAFDAMLEDTRVRSALNGMNP